jgi:hypothetical protein
MNSFKKCRNVKYVHELQKFTLSFQFSFRKNSCPSSSLKIYKKVGKMRQFKINNQTVKNIEIQFSPSNNLASFFYSVYFPFLYLLFDEEHLVVSMCISM